MTMFECFKLYLLMCSPFVISFVGWGVWDWIEAKWERRKKKNHE